MGLISVLLDSAEIRAGDFCHLRLARASIRGNGRDGEARIRGCGRNIIQRRPRSFEDRTRTRSQPRGRRKQQERRKVEQQPNDKTPLGVKIFYAVIGVFVLVVVVLHLTGHSFGGHGH